jgi:Lrp/AsnC family transcriptional regulator, leucine-responsive regulatory protein
LAADKAPLSGLADVAPHQQATVRLDDTDRRILALLAQDARLSQRALARELRMSPPAIGERLGRLERAGVIRGYRVDIDWAALGYVTGYIAVTAMEGADQSEIMRALHLLPEVQEVAVITGSMDMLARLRVRDYAHLRQFLLERVWQMPGIQRTETFLSLAELPSKEPSVDLLGDEEDSARGDLARLPETRA